jgi:hypothetical protein
MTDEGDLMGVFEGLDSISLVEAYTVQAIPDEYPAARFIAYQVLLRVLPLDNREWHDTWNGFVESYKTMTDRVPLALDEWPIRPADDRPETAGLDVELIYRLGVDMNRTKHHFKYIDENRNFEHHMRVLQRILYVFAKFNTTYFYIQGFHELIFPLYYVTMAGCREMQLDESFIEPICFNLLQGLLVGTQFGEFFFLSSPEVVQERFFAVTTRVLEFLDPELAKNLESQLITPLIFAFPWATILFCQMYPIPRLLHVWDVLLANTKEFLEVLVLMVVVHILRLRTEVEARNVKDILEFMREWEPGNEMDQISRCRQMMSLIKIRGCFA